MGRKGQNYLEQSNCNSLASEKVYTRQYVRNCLVSIPS